MDSDVQSKLSFGAQGDYMASENHHEGKGLTNP